MGFHRNLMLSICAVCLCQASLFGQYGPQLTSVGPINRSMAGTSTAAPLDTLGAFLWNPATISDLPSSTDFSLELFLPNTTLSSTVNGVSGSDNSGAGIFPLANFGVVFQPKDSNISYGLGVLSVSGFGVNYPGNPANPVLGSFANGGVGPLYSQYGVLQVVPTMSIKLTEQLSVGVSPMVDLASLSLNPGLLAPPGGASGTIYPPMTSGQYQWGLGVQAGVYYKTDNDWQFGASVKSPQWFNHFGYNSKDPVTGDSDYLKTAINAPLIVSVGSAYTGFDRWLLAADFRYLDYQNAAPFSGSGYTSNGTISGLGWNSIYAISTGAQYTLSKAVSLRGGYSFNTNPISSDQAFFNLASPLILQHGLYCGASYNITQALKVSLAYSHFFENSISGPFISPVGPIPGTNVTSQASADALTIGASFLY
jgi:long-chain fatty acid transport protein